MHKNRFTRIGFILAAAGSAVGLGNIWKFPYIAGENGGGVFVLVYLATVFFIGMSIFIAEVLIGSNSNKDAVTAFETLAPKEKKYWKYGGFSFLTGLLILTFYSVVIGWIFHYIVLSISSLPANFKESEEVFSNFVKNDILNQFIYYTLTFIIIAYTISKGVKKGIEKLNNILMPSLIGILIFLLIYSIQLDGFYKAVEFMFYPNFAKFNTNSIIVAVGHAFFTLSIGMATILTYSASLDKNVNIVKASTYIVIMDTLIALVAGLIIFSITFTAAQEPSKGAGLVFITLPAIFYEMGTIGIFLALLFFIALAFAAITSAVSILEPTVMYLVERKNISRKKATYSIAFFAYLVGIFVLLSNTGAYSQTLTFGSKNLFDWFDFISSAILMPIGGILIAIFVGYILDKEVSKKAIVPYTGENFYKIWLFTIKYVAPISIIAIMLKEIGII
ncbi:sodium-dependent transporter [Arcobacter aquimarinus]|uniref:Transporter n=1 Tax=Arcobacter aquimarinus TaxID=1315211 RepID=A0AAE7E1X9_9BACT|nr:sodium-dependent transporter [Arcobacter aquimarinus]QKE27115.1 sodium-dependent transporter, SNF family [Arcobacter aquimarinus]RXI35480.1 sodium-dependent transporter [Arcobacter aquimarinus]